VTGKKGVLCLLLICVGGFAFRLTIERFFFPMSEQSADAEPSDYWQIAGALADGRGYSYHDEPSARLTPGYPLFLALYRAVFGTGLGPLVVIQALVACASTCLIYKIAKMVFDARAGLLAAAGYAFYPYLARQDVGLLENNFFVPSLALVTVLLLGLRRRPGLRRAALAGGALALAYLIRPTIAVAAPLIALWIVLVVKPFRNALRVLAVLGLVGALGISPWVIRNAIVFDRLILSRSDGGQNVWFGHNDYFERVYPEYSLDCTMSVLQYEWRTHAKAADENPDNDFAMQAFARRKAREYIAEDVGRFLRRAALKVRELYHWRLSPRYRHWWGYVEFHPPDSLDVRYPPDGKSLRNLAYTVPYLIMMALALWGILRLRDEWKDVALFAAFIVSATAAYAVFFGTTKNRAPLDIFFIILAARGITDLVARFTHGEQASQ